MKKTKLIWTSILILAIVIAVVFSLYINNVNEIKSAFSPNPQYEDLDLHTENLQTVLMEAGFNTKLPCIDGRGTHGTHGDGSVVLTKRKLVVK